jgi:kumamolisin
MKRILIALAFCAGCGAPPVGVQPHQPSRVGGALDLGPLDPTTQLEFVVGMKLRDTDGLTQLLALQRKGLEGALTPAQFADRFGATADDYQSVIDWAGRYGLEVTRTVDGRSTLSLKGAVADVQRAFSTEIHRWADSDGTFYAPISAWDSPAQIGGVVGLDDANRWVSQRYQNPNATGSLTPAQLRLLYEFPVAGSCPGGAAACQGEGETIGILGTGYPPSNTACAACNTSCKSDVGTFAYRATGCAVNTKAQYEQVFIGGPNRDPDGLANQEYGENLLDLAMALGLAQNANVMHAFTATNSPGLFSDGITFFVNQAPQVHQVSVSFGTCEAVALSEMSVLNSLFAQAKSQGQQWFFASGDNGTDGCRDGTGNKVLSVNWPSSSPYVVAVGGTQLGGAGGNPITGETVWGGAGAGGGGQSQIIAKPAYQIGVGPYPNDGVRDQPDVAAIAGAPGVYIYAQGSAYPGSEGTSAATPQWAAAWAVIDQLAKNGGGIFNSHECIYKLAGTGFNDITAGNNSDGTSPGYNALVGYDLATGWGSPNVTALAAAVKANCP